MLDERDGRENESEQNASFTLCANKSKGQCFGNTLATHSVLGNTLATHTVLANTLAKHTVLGNTLATHNA